MTDNRLLLILSREYPPVTIGGTSTVARNLGVGLARLGWRVVVVSTNPYLDRDERTTVDGVTVHRVGTGVVYNRVSGLSDSAVRTHRQLYRAANDLIEEFGAPAVIALPDLFCYPEAAMLRREHGVPVVNILLQDFRTLTRQDRSSHRVTSGISASRDHLVALEDKALRGSDHIVFISEALSAAMCAQAPTLLTPHSVVHLGVDPAEIASVSAADDERAQLRATLPDAARHGPLLVGCGRLVPVKGFAELIEALAVVVAAGTTAHLALVGVGPEEPRLRSLAAVHGVEDYVTLLGDISRRTALTWMSLATVGVVPSLWESFCYVCAEMMALGVPVVASAVDSLNELVPTDGFGYRVPVSEHAGRRAIESARLAAALSAALSDPAQARRRADAGRARILGTFTNDRFAAGIAAVCDKLSTGETHVDR